MVFETDFFAALRRMKARRSVAPDPSATAVANQPRTDIERAGPSVSAEGLALVQRFEGCARLRRDRSYAAYPDPGSGGAPWTIGWGATGPGIRRGTVWTQEQCDARLEADLARFASEVARALGDAPTSQGQFDALVSFHYNTGAIARATLTRLHRAGKYAEAAAEFGRWVHAAGKRLTGLVRRRAAEAELYSRG
jgi:lysozyme